MINLDTAYDIAVAEVYIPDDAILTYSNLLSDRYVFEWKHAIADAYSEVDRILIWVDPTSGEVFKKDVRWSILERPLIQAFQLQSIIPTEIEILEYRKIAKKAYFLYSGEPLEDYYWIGKDENTRYLIDDYGNIVGQMIPIPSMDGCSFSGYINSGDTDCWDTEFYADYFNKWVDGYVETGCGISKETYRNRVSDPTTSFYQCTAHGSYSGFRISDSFYVGVSYINSTMADRPPVPFAALASCEAFGSTGPGTISYAFRKGSNVGTVIYGLKNTTNDSWSCYLCQWRGCFYNAVDENKNTPIHQIFHECVATFPDIDGHVGIVGDESLTLSCTKPCTSTINITWENTAEESITFTKGYTLDGVLKDDSVVTLSPGETTSLSGSETFYSVGDYEICAYDEVL
jgi:hypothetical protein